MVTNSTVVSEVKGTSVLAEFVQSLRLIVDAHAASAQMALVKVR